MHGDSGDNRGEAARLLTARERESVARHVAEQLLALTPADRSAAVPKPWFRRDGAGAMPDVAAACGSVLVWLGGTSPAFPLLDDLLREIGAALSAAPRADRPSVRHLAMAACVLASAAIARNRGGLDAELPPGPAGRMVAAAMAEGLHGFREAAE